jgi:hypothetical protein
MDVADFHPQRNPVDVSVGAWITRREIGRARPCAGDPEDRKPPQHPTSGLSATANALNAECAIPRSFPSQWGLFCWHRGFVVCHRFGSRLR